MPALFERLHHVCVVVEDLDATVAYYENLGFGPFYDYPKGSPYVEYNVPNPDASHQMRYRCVDIGAVELQLCQPPRADSPQRRFLDEFGEGVYHLGFETDDLDRDEAGGQALGLNVIASGRRADGTGFCYFDTRKRAGVTLELRRTQRAAVAGGT